MLLVSWFLALRQLTVCSRCVAMWVLYAAQSILALRSRRTKHFYIGQW